MSGIIEPSQEYVDNLPWVVRNRDCVVGQRAIKQGRELYLKPLSSMLDNNGNFTRQGLISYNKYLALTMFYGATGLTVSGYCGLIFRKDPVIELSTNIEYLQDDAAGNNLGLIDQLQKAVNEAIITPRSAVLVDFPQTVGQVDKATAEKLKLRPRLLHFPFESIIKVHYEIVNNQYQLQFAVLKEKVSTVEDYVVTEGCQYRLLELLDGVYNHSLWNEDGEIIQDRQQVLINNSPATEIPLYIIESNDGQSALIDQLVDVNLTHYEMFASYANKEHMSGFPIFYETGYLPETDENGCVIDSNNKVGPGVRWTSSNPDAQFGILETQSDGGSLRQFLEDRKTEMASLGADALSPRTTQAESGESKKLDKVGQNATVADVANTVSRAYTLAIQFAAGWMGTQNDDSYVELNTDYIPEEINAQLLTSLLAAYQGGAISFETFYRALQKGEIADPEVTAEDEQSRITISEGGLDQ